MGAGDPDLALAFVRRFQRIVFGVALTVVGDTGLAEDVAQQGFERAWRSAALYDPRRGSVRTWLTSIVHNLAVDAVRARRPAPVAPQDLIGLIGAMSDLPERRALAQDAADQLRRALAGLPTEQARAVVLAGIHGLTAREIAEQEGIPIGTAKSRIRGAMLKLHTALAAEQADHD
ncbi:sigma-70 family RNA polymerase sigma factor [Pseudonocardia sp. K10HN5]|uniref:Sigma-70 family RNA polymerase sigma factor n=1 Tax=Pseudonocardia acidicola TaxID=2724939 RepID=A0ABX1SGP1_9PSEU|nr:sigma-70 family RNA polymerase sigma factor [Pseudonocardia acidicola]